MEEGFPAVENEVYSEKVLLGQQLEKSRDMKFMFVDICFYTTIMACLPTICLCLCWWLPAILFCVLPVLICLSHSYIVPKQVPLSVKLVSMIMKIGYVAVGCCPPRWGQVLFYAIMEVRSAILKSKIEVIQINDGLRRKLSTAKIYVYDDAENDEDLNQDVVPVVMYYLHGGGYIISNPESLDDYYKELVKLAKVRGKIDLKVYALDYRKAPRWKVDSILRQTIEVMKWIIQQNPNHKLVLCGDSAGGNLSCLIANYIRDHNYEIIAKENLHVIPLYPVLLRVEDMKRFDEDENYTLKSRKEYFKRGTIIWGKPMGQFEKVIYGDDPFDGEYNNYDFYSDEHLQNLPSHFIITAEYDFLRDDGELYYLKLMEQLQREKTERNDDHNSSSSSQSEKEEGGEEVSSGESSSSSEKEEEEEEEGEEEEEIFVAVKAKKEEKFEYFKYMVMEGECHGFNNNLFPVLKKETKPLLYDVVLTNLEEKFC